MTDTDKEFKIRMYGLDMFRVSLALLVFMFHSRMHIGCSYGLLNPFVNMGAIAMTAFYLLSGYVLYSTSSINPVSVGELVRFYKKRFIALYPAFLFVALAAILVSIIANPSLDHCIKHIVQLPVLLVGISTVFTSLFKLSPNGGLWFVSCLFFCYALYPWFAFLVLKLDWRRCCFLCGFSVFLLLYSPFVVKVHGLASIYTNPFFRILEFLIGVSLGRLCQIICPNLGKKKWLMLVVVTTCILIGGVSLLNVIGIGKGNYMLYSWVSLPCFCVLIVMLGCEMRLQGGWVLLYCSNLSYSFFLGQFFCFKMFRIATRVCPIIADYNVMKIAISFVICFIFACLVYHLVQCPAKDFLSYRLFNSKFRRSNVS